ncbi:MAG: hypothetical protein ABIH52_03735 [Candidatus Aenigmatarchaeota archaeon]|nr:hypothetical protein [Nanoarchaeota archaeon]
MKRIEIDPDVRRHSTMLTDPDMGEINRMAARSIMRSYDPSSGIPPKMYLLSAFALLEDAEDHGVNTRIEYVWLNRLLRNPDNYITERGPRTRTNW